MVSQLTTSSLTAIPKPSIVRHPLLQTVEGTVQVFTSAHRSFFTNVMVQALRTAGQGTPVLVVQFLKGGIGQGADQPMQLGQNLDWVRSDMAHCVHTSDVTDEDRIAIQDLWQHTQRVVQQGRYALVVLDELSLAMTYGLIAEAEVLHFLKQRPPQVDVVLTGPAMPDSILEVADQVTQFRRNFLP
ncbi:MAG: P-loop NTPase family protein [Cyanobacteria bacterium Co-bin8]|nr:P-loop NTPase family protein [Cyanobacteria bacterium Co-bin8]